MFLFRPFHRPYNPNDAQVFQADISQMFIRAHRSENDLERHRLIIGFSGGNFNGKTPHRRPRTQAADNAVDLIGDRVAAACLTGIDRVAGNRGNLYDIFTDLPEIVVIL